MKNKVAYFLSDFHLGVPSQKESRIREDKIVSFLKSIEKDASVIYFLGDLFDFWFEWKQVVPKGFVRFLAQIAQMVEKGIEIHFFKGNHDMWQFGYLEKELGIQLHSDELETEINGKKFFLHHGDGLEKQDKYYNLLKKIFRSHFFQWLFARIHPNTSIFIAQYFSKTSRKQNKSIKKEQNVADDWLYQYAKNHFKNNQHINFYLFGHRHHPLVMEINKNCSYVNIGDWLQNFTYARYEKQKIELLNYAAIKKK